VRKKKPVTSKAEVIPDAGHELILARVCGIDVAKASASVCVRVPPANGKRRASQVREVPATMNTVVELAEELAAKGIGKAHCRVERRLLADLVLSVGGGRVVGPVGQRQGCEERGGPGRRPTS
jgi:hypothetical protein